MPTAEESARGLKQGKSTRNGTSPAWRGFIDIDLTDADKDVVRDMSTEAEDVLGIVAELVEDGNKLTLSNDAAHNSYVAAVTSRNAASPNAGLTLSGRGSTLWKAVNALWYKYASLAEGGAWENVPGNRAIDDVG